MKASAVLNDKDVWAIAAAQSSLFFSFQLVLPNGRADEKKEEKKGIGRTSRIENGIKRFIFLWNEQWRLAQRKQSIFFFFVGGLWAHCANGSAKRRKQRRLIDWSWRMKGQRSLVEERMKWSQWMKRIDEMEFFRCPTKHFHCWWIKERKLIGLARCAAQEELNEQDSRNEVNKVEWMEWWRARGASGP